MANAVLSDKMQKRISCICNFLIAAGLGAVFVGLKCSEYYEKYLQGKMLGTNAFFDFYWLLIGFHLIHILLGIGLIIVVTWQVGTNCCNTSIRSCGAASNLLA